MEVNKLPPSNIEAEEAILGSILFDPRVMVIAKDLLPKSRAFYIGSHQTIYQAFLDLESSDKDTDFISVSNYLSDRGLLDKIGGTTRLSQLLNRTVSSVNIDRYCKLVADKSIKRDLIEYGQKTINLGYDQTQELEEVLTKSQQNLQEVVSQNFASEMLPNDEVSTELYESLDKNHRIYPTGFTDLDEMMDGFEPGTLTVLAGRPSMGKSAIALNLAFKQAVDHKLPVTFFSLEMTRRQLESRLWSLVSVQPFYKHLGVSPLPGDRLRKSRTNKKPLDDLERQNIANIHALALELPLYINDNRCMTVAGIGANLRSMKNKFGNLGLVVVDYLQMMNQEDSQNRSYELGSIARSLYQLSGELDVPILALSQVNRACEARNDKRPMMSDLSQSGVLEMVADNIIFCYRDEYYEPETCDRNVLELILRKARHGETGTAKLFFDKTHGNIQDLY